MFGFPFWRKMSCFHGTTVPTWCTFGCFFQDTPISIQTLMGPSASISSPSSPPQKCENEEENHPLLIWSFGDLCFQWVLPLLHYQTLWDPSLYSNCETSPFASNLPHISCICLFSLAHLILTSINSVSFSLPPSHSLCITRTYTWGGMYLYKYIYITTNSHLYVYGLVLGEITSYFYKRPSIKHITCSMKVINFMNNIQVHILYSSIN